MIFSKNILIIILSISSALLGYSQVTQIFTGTNTHLRDLSVINHNIMICGYFDYLVKSVDECSNLSTVLAPGPLKYAKRLQRLDTNNIFLLPYSPSQTLLYKSSDGGKSWQERLDTIGAFNREMAFFDSTEGVITEGTYLLRTKDGGNTWTNGSNFTYLGLTSIGTDGDSMICVGGLGVSGGGFRLSKDRGQTWPYVWGGFGKIQMTDFFFLNRDTVFGVSEGGAFVKTTDGGNNWDGSSEPPISNSFGVYFKNGKEGYVVGTNSQSIGIVVKTTDLGKTWSSFNTGIKTVLMNMAILNDSIAILTGSDGVLLRWNYNNTLFTSVDENYLNSTGLKIFPNPAKDKLRFEIENVTPDQISLKISNTLGQAVYSQNKIELEEELDVSFLKSGVYYFKLESQKGQKVFKVVKE